MASWGNSLYVFILICTIGTTVLFGEQLHEVSGSASQLQEASKDASHNMTELRSCEHLYCIQDFYTCCRGECVPHLAECGPRGCDRACGQGLTCVDGRCVECWEGGATCSQGLVCSAAGFCEGLVCSKGSGTEECE